MSERPFADLRHVYGLRQTSEYDASRKEISIITKYDDVQPMLDENTAKRNAGRDYYAADPEMWRVASIPIGVQYEWFTRHGVAFWKDDHWPAVKRLLNSSDYRYLKTADVII